MRRLLLNMCMTSIRLPLMLAYIITLMIVFWGYSGTRCMLENYGFDWKSSLYGVIVSAIMVGPILTTLFFLITGWPRLIGFLVSSDECAYCGYSKRGLTSSQCPECGSQTFNEDQFRDAIHLKQYYLIICLLLSIPVGSLFAECWILIDEHGFQSKVIELRDSGSTAAYSRSRCWPNGATSLVFDPLEGIHATD